MNEDLKEVVKEKIKLNEHMDWLQEFENRDEEEYITVKDGKNILQMIIFCLRNQK